MNQRITDPSKLRSVWSAVESAGAEICSAVANGIVWTPSTPQARALSIDIYEILYGGARGGGKTDTGIVFMMLPACGPNAFPGYAGLVLRKNHTDLCDWIARANKFYSAYGAKKTGTDFFFPNGAVIRTGHLKDEEAYEKYQGHEYQRILIEELTQIPDEQRYLMILGSCRSTIPGLRPSIFCTANPGGQGHGWVKRRFIDSAPAGKAHYSPISTETQLIGGPTGKNWRIYIPAKIEDNPALAGDKTYLAFLDGLPEKLRKAWREGNWDILAGQYFPEFDRSVHVVEPFKIPAHWRIEAGLDWGYNPDPWACVWIAIDEYGDIVVFREATGNQMIPSEAERRILELSGTRRPKDVIADPSMWSCKDGDSTAVKFEKLVLTKADNTRVQGWMRINEYMR
ncbi:MAG: hypothetical protein EOM70_13545, partial [Clostridia bacterium]|nr:hypothetical protein [Clostridia bacterium]